MLPERIHEKKPNLIEIITVNFQQTGKEHMSVKKKKQRRRTNDRVTLADIARHCDVSKATVSRVLNDRLNEFPVSEEMIQRVKNAAEQLDYRPNRLARAIRSQRTH
ncbi:MAG: hypothetical protein DRP64_14260, partial [Verrucomicrobia bacterium]